MVSFKNIHLKNINYCTFTFDPEIPELQLVKSLSVAGYYY